MVPEPDNDSVFGNALTRMTIIHTVSWYVKLSHKNVASQ
jgi:hypothetical protein